MGLFRPSRLLFFMAGTAALALGGCAEQPTGPTVAVWPPPGKPFGVFRADDAACRHFARTQVRARRTTAAQRAVIGTVLGAAAGALITDSSRGAGPGAGIGLLMGSSAGANAGRRGAATAQRRYNIAYEQCMYAKGDRIPGAPRRAYPPPPPPSGGS